MSVAMMIYYNDPDRKREYKPITFQDTYNTYWRPVAESENLYWVWGVAGHGIDLVTDSIDEIEQDFLTLRDHLQSNDDIEAKHQEYHLQDIDKILSMIVAVRTEPALYKRVFIF